MAHVSDLDIDPKNGFCKSNSVFYNKRKPLPLPQNQTLDVATFISSCPHNGRIAFIDAASGDFFTFVDFWKAVDSVADCLSGMGIKKGNVVLLLSPNSIFFPVIVLAVMSIGAIITTTNPLNTNREIAKQIADSKPVIAFTIQPLLSKLAGSDIPVILIGGRDESVAVAHSFYVLSTLPEMMRTEPSQSRVKERVSLDDTACLLYSSGTTGESKGVVSSHRNIITCVQTIAGRFQSKAGEQIYLCTVPMFHTYGLSAFATGLLSVGSTVVILSKFELDEMLSAIGKYRVTCLPLVPPILVALINNEETIKKKYDLSSLQSILSGGAPLSKEVTEGFVEKYPNVMIQQGYGLTESTSVGASTDTMDDCRRYGTAGLLSAGMEAKIVDPETGESFGVNRTGELWLRGPSIMKGYLGNDEATASTIVSEGWLRTGDMCYIDDDGYIFVIDRLKELIKYKGYQVAPAELEALLLSHPEITDAAVIPFPDAEAGQYPMAYVVRRVESNLSESGVMDFVAKQVAPYKKVRRVAFVGSIPKNPSGKILRKDLIKLATSKL